MLLARAVSRRRGAACIGGGIIADTGARYNGRALHSFTAPILLIAKNLGLAISSDSSLPVKTRS